MRIPNKAGDEGMLFEIPKFHEDIEKISLKNFYKIRNTYSDIIGIGQIDHFSINIIDPEDKIAILSYNPAVILSLLKESVLAVDGTLSPTVFKKKEIYTWNEAYSPIFAEQIKEAKEYKFHITKGVILVRKCDGFHFIYSFATKRDGRALHDDILVNKYFYFQMGDHCYKLIRDIYLKYSKFYSPPSLIEK